MDKSMPLEESDMLLSNFWGRLLAYKTETMALYA